MSNVGETVRLKSGGPMMTCIDVTGSAFSGWTSHCVWFDAAGKHSLAVPNEALWLWDEDDEERERRKALKAAQPRKPRKKRTIMLGHDRISP